MHIFIYVCVCVVVCNQQMSVEWGRKQERLTAVLFPGFNFQQQPWPRPVLFTGEPKRIRLRLFCLGASNRIPIPRLLSLSILVSTINFPLQSRELLHDRIHIAVNIAVSVSMLTALPTASNMTGSLVRLWTAIPVF